MVFVKMINRIMVLALFDLSEKPFGGTVIHVIL